MWPGGSAVTCTCLLVIRRDCGIGQPRAPGRDQERVMAERKIGPEPVAYVARRNRAPDISMMTPPSPSLTDSPLDVY